MDRVISDLPSRNDLFAAGRRYAKGVPGTRINPAVIDVAGSDLNLLLGSASLMGEAIVAAMARCMRSLFIDTAVGDELDRVAYDRFGITRKGANAANVAVNLFRPGAGPGGTVPAGTRVATASGSVFALDTDVVFSLTDFSRPGTATALVVGPSMNIPAQTLQVFQDQPFDPNISVTNPGPAAGGTDAESDAQFRGRIRVYFLTLRRGTLGAVQYAATTVPGVSVSTAFDIINPGSALPAGAVQLIIADDDGFASPAMVQGVKDVLLQFRSGGIPVFVSGGSVIFETAVYNLDFATGIDTVSASEEVRAVAVAVTQFYQPGQTMLRSDLLAAARAVPGVIVGSGALPVPVGDVVPANNTTIIRLRPVDVSFV